MIAKRLTAASLECDLSDKMLVTLGISSLPPFLIPSFPEQTFVEYLPCVAYLENKAYRSYLTCSKSQNQN